MIAVTVGFDNKLQHHEQSKCVSANTVTCYAATVSATWFTTAHRLSTGHIQVTHNILTAEENTNTPEGRFPTLVGLTGGEILENF